MGKRATFGVVGVWLLTAGMAGQVQGAGAVKPKAPATARWSEMKQLVLRTPFDNLRYPHLDDGGNITFIADDEYYSGPRALNPGIYRYQADGSLVCLVRGGETVVPGGVATLKSMASLQMDGSSGDLVFHALDSDGKGGLYHWSKGKLATVARTGETVLPGDTGPLTLVEYGTLHGNHLLYKAGSAGYGAALVLRDLNTGQDQVLCRSGMAVPGHPDDTFQFIGNTNFVSGDSVIFRAARVKDPLKEGKHTRGIYGWFGIKDWSGATGDFAPERLQTVADGHTRMPLAGTAGNVLFDELGSAPVGGNDTVFEASSGKFVGMFTARTPDGPVRCIASNQTDFDGPFKGHFTGFGGYPTVNGQNVVFTAVAEEGNAKPAADTEDGDEDDGAADARAANPPKTYRGIFVYRLDRGELFTLVDNLEPLDDREIDWFEIGGHALVGDHFAVTVHFKDKTSRLYLGTIKPEAFKQLNEGAAAGAKKAEPTP